MPGDATFPLRPVRAAAAHRAPLPDAKYRLLRDQVAAALPRTSASWKRPQPATANWPGARTRPTSTAVAAGHLVRGPSSARSVSRGANAWWSARVRSVGATIAAARAALGRRRGRADLAGGTHHAYAHKGSGYCVFNDVAVAARLMQAEMAPPAPRAAAGAGDRPGRAPGQRHRRHLCRRRHACSPSRCTARATSRSARRPATWTWNCPTAAADDALPGGAGPGAGQRGSPCGRPPPGPGLLPGRGRSARGRPPGPLEAQQPRAWPNATNACWPGCARAASRWP